VPAAHGGSGSEWATRCPTPSLERHSVTHKDFKFTGIYEEIEEIVGRKATLALAEQYGGVRISIPAKLPDGHWLIKLIGADKAKALADYFAVGTGTGNYISGIRHVVLPAGPFGSLSRVRNELQRSALASLQNGGHPRQVARNLKVSERTIWRWRARWINEGLL